jgi:hypothetical protein
MSQTNWAPRLQKHWEMEEDDNESLKMAFSNNRLNLKLNRSLGHICETRNLTKQQHVRRR